MLRLRRQRRKTLCRLFCRPILASGVVLHVLPNGARFDLTTRQLLPLSLVADPLEELEIAEAGRDLRQMARDIAAADASPTSLRRRLRRSRDARQASRSDQDGDIPR